MAKNLGRKFATMSDDERRRFALEEEAGTNDQPAELSFDEPRNEDNMGPQFSSIGEEVADPEHRDGMSALLDDEQHEEAVREASTRQDDRTTESE
jgi:hypothetical protein